MRLHTCITIVTNENYCVLYICKISISICFYLCFRECLAVLLEGVHPILMIQNADNIDGKWNNQSSSRLTYYYLLSLTSTICTFSLAFLAIVKTYWSMSAGKLLTPINRTSPLLRSMTKFFQPCHNSSHNSNVAVGK